MPRKRREHPWLDTINGVYYAFWYDKARRRTERLSLRTSDPDEAPAKFAAFLIEGSDVYRGQPQKETLTINNICEFYLESCRKKPVGERAVRSVLRPVMETFGDHMAPELTPELIEEYAAGRTSRKSGTKVRKVASGTIRTELVYLRAAINYAIKRKRMSPADAPDFDLPPASPARERWLTYEELDALRAAAGDTGLVRWFIELAYFTASRKTALETLTWFQVDRVNKQIKLNPEGRRQTKKRRPTVPIVTELDQWLTSIPKTGLYVLGGDRPAAVWGPFGKAVAAAGLDGVTPHTLRHTRAVHLAQQGRDLYVIAGLLGDSVSTVEQNYLHHCPDHLRAALEGAKSSSIG